MTMTTRGRTMLGVLIAVLLLGGAVGAVILVGGKAGEGTQGGPPSTSASAPPSSPAPPPVCPLTGVRVDAVPQRPALAVKVENLPASRPQTGLSWADLIYEEPVEAGITRFIVIYQCKDASRIEPVRSARFTDINVLKQFGKPIFGYAGGVGQVISAVRAAGFVDVNYTTARAAKAYHRDPNRQAPHNLYTSTKGLYGAAKELFQAQPPDPVFTYGGLQGIGKKVSQAHIPFSSSSDVFWKWSSSKREWLRYHGDAPHLLSNGSQVTAKNVVVQVVKTELTDVTDTNGVRSPRAITVGSGKAYVFRNGRVIVGKWSRPTVGAVTKFVDRAGKEIPLSPGNTWIELLPKGIKVTYS